MRTPRKTTALILTAAMAVFGAGCGGDDGGSKGGGGDDGGKSSGGKVDTAQAKKLFGEKCASCHVLADANANGTFGPNLDELAPSAEDTARQIESGGGGMPADLLEGEDKDAVAAYVEEVAGHGGE